MARGQGVSNGAPGNLVRADPGLNSAPRAWRPSDAVRTFHACAAGENPRPTSLLATLSLRGFSPLAWVLVSRPEQALAEGRGAPPAPPPPRSLPAAPRGAPARPPGSIRPPGWSGA